MRQSSDAGSVPDWTPTQLLDDVIESANVERLKQRVAFPLVKKTDMVAGLGIIPETDVAEEHTRKDETPKREASLSHILTNVSILQEFILEIIAILQVRASMFSEVKFA